VADGAREGVAALAPVELGQDAAAERLMSDQENLKQRAVSHGGPLAHHRGDTSRR
jgi:hypothetical protein